MVIIRLIGGLGNQMFQYAIGRSLSLKRGDILKLSKIDYENQKGITHREYLLNIFNIKEIFASKKEISKLQTRNKILIKLNFLKKGHILEKNTNCYDESVLSLSGDIFLDGYWQTEKYFCNISDTIRKDFSLRCPLSENVKKFLYDIKKNESISIHFRRGDYISNLNANKFHGVCDLEYYKNAINYFNRIKKDFKFFIFSDDIEWVKDNFKINNSIFVSGDGINDFEEMFLMSKCNHNIIANSSFSWWGAWLNDKKDKIVIAPKRWNNSNCYDDIVPEKWIKI